MYRWDAQEIGVIMGTSNYVSVLEDEYVEHSKWVFEEDMEKMLQGLMKILSERD